MTPTIIDGNESLGSMLTTEQHNSTVATKGPDFTFEIQLHTVH